MRAENSFIPVHGVGEQTERTLWSDGINHWDAFDRSALGETLSTRVLEFIETARDRLARNDVCFFANAFPSGYHWRLYENFKHDAVFLDIETTGLGAAADVTVVGIHHDGVTRTLVKDRNLTRSQLAQTLDQASILVTFNGRSFDVPALERAFELSIDLPHLDLRYPCRRLGLTGGLKAVETTLGIDRDRPDLSGRDAVRLWHEHQRGDHGALRTLIDYNRADTANLRPLADHVVSALHDDVFETI